MAWRWVERLRETLTPKPRPDGRHRTGTSVEDLRRRIQQEPEKPPVTPPAPPVEPPRPPPGPGIFLEPLVHDKVADTKALFGVHVPPGLDAEQLISELGARAAFVVANQQNESGRAYAHGDDGLGNTRFVDQVEYLERLTGREIVWEWLRDRRGRETYRVAIDFVQWFYYHTIRSM